MSRSTKSWIKGMRVVQLVLRVLELIGAIGLLTLMILTDNVEDLTAWVLRITVSCEPLPSVCHAGQFLTVRRLVRRQSAALHLCHLPSLPSRRRTHPGLFGSLPYFCRCLRPVYTPALCLWSHFDP